MFRRLQNLAPQSIVHRSYESALVWTVLVGSGLLAVLPLLLRGLPGQVDRPTHLQRLAVLDLNIRTGELFPRWVPQLILGKGYPLFNYYGAGSYYLAEPLLLLGFSLHSASLFTILVIVLFAGIGMYMLASDVLSNGSRWGALVAAIAYMYAPYFLATNIYRRGAIPEAAAQALMPWILWCARRIFTSSNPARYTVALSFTLAALMFSHTLSILLFPPVLVGYIVVVWLQTGRSASRLLWAVAGCGLASGVAAFFWVPLMFERGYLSELAYGIASSSFMSNSAWTWTTIVDSGLQYRSDGPPRLGLVQFTLAAVGALLLIFSQRTAERLYLLIIGVVAALLIGGWATPIWTSNEILIAVQFAWRTMSIVTLALSMMIGALVAYFPYRSRAPWLVSIFAIVMIVGYIFANAPTLENTTTLSTRKAQLSQDGIAAFDYINGAERLGEQKTLVQEFRPIWADSRLEFDGSIALAEPMASLSLLQASAYQRVLTMTTEAPVTLRFNDFYFPGWRARLNSNTSLSLYPSTNLGLLTLDIPAGTHQLSVSWEGTLLQRYASLFSMLVLATLVLICWRWRLRSMMVLSLGLLAIGIVAYVMRPSLSNIEQPVQVIEESGIRMAGYRVEQDDASSIQVLPYWYSLRAQEPDLVVAWELRDGSGQVVTERRSYPYYGVSRANSWAPGTVIDDAYRIQLAPGLLAGEYELFVGFEGNSDAATDSESTARYHVGGVILHEDVPTVDAGMNLTYALYDDEVRLAGFASSNLERLGRDPLDDTSEGPPIVEAGDLVEYSLYWQADANLSKDYHSYLHLKDHLGRPLLQYDHGPSLYFLPSTMWDKYSVHEDPFVLRIPSDAESGLYWPSVGLYECENITCVPDIVSVAVDGVPVPGDDFKLPPIKIVGEAGEPDTRLTAKFSDGIELLGYSQHLPANGLYPGDAFTVDLVYRIDGRTTNDYTRFLQLHSPELGMAAQSDGLPQEGVNPTWSWTPEETIIDSVRMEVSKDATPGEYSLFTGFYSADDGERLAVVNGGSDDVASSSIELATVMVNRRSE